jgi:hypothetical protein
LLGQAPKPESFRADLVGQWLSLMANEAGETLVKQP